MTTLEITLALALLGALNPDTRPFTVVLVWSDGHTMFIGTDAATPEAARDAAVEHCPEDDRAGLLRAVVVDARPEAVRCFDIGVRA